MAGQNTRIFTVPNGACGIPSNALAYSFNVAVVPHGAFAYLTAWPTGQTQPYVTTLNSDGRVKSSAAIIPAGTGGAVSVFVTQDADIVLDLNGYFAPLSTAGGLAYYAVAPCRISDTRVGTGPFGGPFIPGQTSRTIPVPLSACNVPLSAQAYSLNLTAVPRGPLGFLTSWPTGSARPLVASLNASTGTITSNAAIVSAGSSGSIDVFASNDTDLVVDITGYFAPAGQSGALSLYSLTPCRELDSRLPAGSPPFSGTLNAVIASTACGVPYPAQAYILNAVALPQSSLGYLTLWAQGTVQPTVSSLNAPDGAITNNLALVSTANGAISAFASNPIYLVLDIFGYFAP